MADLELDTWPIGELTTERLVLRESRPEDRDGLIAMLTSPDVYRYLGGAMSRGEAEIAVQPPYGTRPASFVIRERATGEFVGGVSVKRNDRTEPLVRPVDLGYLLLPEYWGRGYAQEAITAVLRWLASVVPDEQVVAVTQTTNESSLRLLKKLGFVEIDRFEEYGADQSMLAAALPRDN
ncbi:GNAT family N-acetyltransferase [Kribbella sp. NPDC056861]|uniref:GNAT family N-acetyltransferase n=1 Tax=Kribbella sp. NPDC056861 TaxID=3154857 RepID=UPI00343F28A6